MNNKPRILFYDIENSPNKLYDWDIRARKYPVHHNNIIEERKMISVSWKWRGVREVYTATWRKTKDGFDDSPVCLAIQEAFLSSDMAVAHFGDRHDRPFINSRLVKNGLGTLPRILHEDTYKIARREFKFNSNRLDYLASYLGVWRKLKTEFDLWKKCLNGDPKALEKMVRYNRHDVYPLLQGVWEILAPYAKTKINYNLFSDSEILCSHCGSENYSKRGYNYSMNSIAQRYQCLDCKHWFSGPYKHSTTIRG